MKTGKILNKIIAATCAAVSLVPLAACGSTPNELESRVDEYGNKIVTIMFHKASGTPEATAYKEVIDAFVTAHNNEIIVEAEYVNQSAGVNQYQTTLTQKYKDGGGALYDIIAYDAPLCAGYAQSGMLYNSTELLGDYVNEFVPNSIPKYNGNVYGLPIQEASAGFYINKEWFSKAKIKDSEIESYKKNGWTYDDFYKVCGKLKSAGCSNPVDFQLGSSDKETRTFLMYPFGYSAGGDYATADGKTVTNHFNSENTAKGVEFIKKCIDNKYTNKNIGSTDFLSKKQNEAGSVAMFLSAGWTITQLKGSYSGNFNGGYGEGWDILPYPSASKASAASATGSWCFGITDNGIRDKSVAVELIKWLTSAESAQTIADKTGMLNARTDAKYTENTPEKFFRDQLLATGKARPAMTAYADFTTEFNLMLDDFTNGGKDVLTTLNERASSLQDKINRNR